MWGTELEALPEGAQKVSKRMDDTFGSRRRSSTPSLSGDLPMFKQVLFDLKNEHNPMLNDEVSMGTTVEALRAQLGECLDVLRQVDSERCSLLEKTEQMQKVFETEFNEGNVMRSQIIESHRELRKAQRDAMEAKTKVRKMEASLSFITEEKMRLRRFLRSLPIHREETLVLVPDRRFEEAFRDKMSVIRYKRRYEQVKRMYEERSEMIEADAMAMEDRFITVGDLDEILLNSSVSQIVGDISQLNATCTLNDTSSRNALSSCCMPFFGVGNTAAFSFQLPFSHITEEEAYIKTQIEKSAYKEPLKKLRSSLFRSFHRLKHLQDAGFNNMYTMTFEASRGGSCSPHSSQTELKKAFETTMEKIQLRQRDLLNGLVGLVNSCFQELIKHELKSVSKVPVPKRDAECTVYFTTPLDLRLADIEERFQLHRRKVEPHVESERWVEACSVEKTDTAMRQKAMLILKQLISLHKGFRDTVESLHAFCPTAKEKWRDAFLDMSLVGTEDTLDDPRFEAKIVEAVEVDVQYAVRLVECAQLALTPTSPFPRKKRSTGLACITGSPERKTATKHQEKQHRRFSRPLYLPRDTSINGRRVTVDFTVTHPIPARTPVPIHGRFTKARLSISDSIACESIPEGDRGEEVKSGPYVKPKEVQTKAQVSDEARFANSYSVFTTSKTLLPLAPKEHRPTSLLPNGRKQSSRKPSINIPHFRDKVDGI